MKNKIVLCFVLMLCCFPLVASAESNNSFLGPSELNSGSFSGVEIVVGEVIELNSETFTELPSEIGGLISNFTQTISKVLRSFFGLPLHSQTTITELESFELIAVPAGTQEFTSITDVSTFESSLPVILKDRTTTEHIFVTKNIIAETIAPDFQSLPYATITTDFGTLEFISWEGPSLTYKIDGGENLFTPKLACDSNCPLDSDILVASGLVLNTDYVGQNIALISEWNNMKISVLKMDTITYVLVFVDANNNNIWEILDQSVPGFSTESFEKNTLLLAEPGTYDIWVVQ